MKINKNAAAVLSLAALSVAPAWGADKARTNAGDDWAKHVQQAAEPASPTMANKTSGTRLGPHAALFGSVVPAGTASRTIMLRPGMKTVNVASGEAVAFADGDRSVAWQFGEFVHGSTVDLGDLFPSMPSARGVRVNIDRSQIFTGG